MWPVTDPTTLMDSLEYIVYIVDDDESVCEALCELFTSLGVRSVAFGSVADYVSHPKPDLPACLILSVELPDINGLEFQRALRDTDDPPIILITGHGDIPSSVRALKDGAVDFLPKPFSQEDLLAAVTTGLDWDRKAWVDRIERVRLQQRYALLTPRESEVPLVVSGRLNKQAAAALGISEATLSKSPGSRLMKKMAAESFADLGRMAGRLDIALEPRKQQ
jgi:FixJ family two-component response regulator